MNSTIFLLACLIFGLVLIMSVVMLFFRFKRQAAQQGGLFAEAERRRSQHPAYSFSEARPAPPSGAAFGIALGLLLATFAVFGIGILFQMRQIREAQLLEREGVPGQATITERSTYESEDGSDTYYIHYMLRGEGWQVTRRESVPRSMYRTAEPGAPIAVIYAPSNPQISRIAARYRPGAVSYMPLLIAGLVALVFGLMALFFFSQYLKASRLDEQGVLAPVKILDMYTSSDSDSTTHYVAYRVPGGEPIRHSVQSKIYRRLAVGDQVTVRYLLNDPTLFRPEWKS
jgi:hypothetical protein